MNYNESEQKQILRELEDDLLALIAVDLKNDLFEVIYSDGSYHEYENRYQRRDFFEKWRNEGIYTVYEPDREHMLAVMDREYLLKALEREDVFITTVRFLRSGIPASCRIKAAFRQSEPDVLLISIRDIDREVRIQKERIMEMERLLQKEREMRELKE